MSTHTSLVPDARSRQLAALAYLTPLPAIALRFVPQLRATPFVIFHAWQSMIFWVLAIVLIEAGAILSGFAFAAIWLLFAIIFGFAVFFTWLVLTIKAWQGEWFQLPRIGEWAARQR